MKIRKVKRKKRKERNGRFPIWKVIIFNYEYVICRMKKHEPMGWRVLFHITELGTKSIPAIKRMARKQVNETISEIGGTLEDVYVEDELIPHFKEQLQLTGTIPVMINEEEVCFETEKAAKIMQTIVKCAIQHRRVTILYTKSTGKVVKRDIAPYSMKDNYLYATDTRDGNTKIKSFNIYSIKSAKRSLHKYKPQWSIEL